MYNLLVITPVKDSIETTLQTIRAVRQAQGNQRYIVYNDFSTAGNKAILEKNREELDFELVNLEDLTSTPSPNYRLVLRIAQQTALEMNVPLVIIESDVTIQPDTLGKMLTFSRENERCGMVGAVTTDESGNINFPYLNFRKEKKSVVDTSHRLSFCCTLLTTNLLNRFSFQELTNKKNWYDVFISRKSRSLGFRNFLMMNVPVIHRPHSSRPWKQLKYTNPVKYYLIKFFKRKDRI